MTEEEIHNFFNGSLSVLPSFYEMKDMPKAAEFLAGAILEKKQIGIYGDYDVDGTTSCALLIHFLKLCEGNENIHALQPSRFKEGYGLHESSIDDAIAKGIEILITVDCGITAVSPAAYAKEKNLTLIITDHHQDIAPTLPDAFAVINPNRRDDGHPQLGAIAGVGVAFALSVCIRQELMKRGKTIPSLYPLLAFVGLGSLADLAKLNFVNRLLVGHGLRAMEKTPYPGVRLLYETYGPSTKEYIKSDMVGFGIGPLINAKGRMEHPESALKLLTSHDEVECQNLLQELQIINQQRKDKQKQMAEEAIKIVERETNSGEHSHSIVVYRSDWHEGVIGIVASKLVDHFAKPALVFAKDAHTQGLIKGSARAPKGFNIFQYLELIKPLFHKFGGHSAAAGMTLPEDSLLDLKVQLNQVIEKDFPTGVPSLLVDPDLEIQFEDITFEFFMALQTLEPFGNGNPAPIFKIKDIVLEDFTILRGGHLQWMLGNGKTGFGKRAIKGISFFYLSRPGKMGPQQLLDLQNKQKIKLNVIAKISENIYREKRSLQLEVMDFILPATH